MDSGQRHKIIKQLLAIASDPDRRSVAKDLFCDEEKVPATVETLSVGRRFSNFWGSTPVWGAVGILFGVLASQYSIRFGFFAVWAGLWGEFIRTGFFDKRWTRWSGNAAVGMVLAIILITVQPYVKPQQQPTLDQQMDIVTGKLATRFPWLTSPPRTPQASVHHTNLTYLSPNAIGPPVIQGPLLPLHVGQELGLNIAFVNGGNFPILSANTDSLVFLSDAKDIEAGQVFKKNRYRLKPTHAAARLEPYRADLNNFLFHTFAGPTLTANDVSQIVSGEKAVCVVGIANWKDESGQYETDLCTCFVGHDTTWGGCKENNRETRRP